MTVMSTFKSKNKHLAENDLRWVEETLVSLSLEEQVAQLMIPALFDEERATLVLDGLAHIPVGGIFVWNAPAEAHRERIARFQNASRLPLLVAADLENGPGYVVRETPAFPDTLAVAAADDPNLAQTMAEAAAVYGKAAGINWTYAPIVDVNLNPDNPIANTRSLGDNPDRIARLAGAMIRGFQGNGIAACAKHFPGDGVDDHDQHVTASVNTLDLESWKKMFGRTFSAAMAEDVWTIMAGHIALPAWDNRRDRRGCTAPATVNRRILQDLLRDEMGFDGLIVSDDMNMGGVAGYADRATRTLDCIAAGCDMLLFPSLPDDYHTLLAGLKEGRLTSERVEEAARRVLTLKARLGLHRGTFFGPPPTDVQKEHFEKAADSIAERAVFCVRNQQHLLPLSSLPAGAKVLTVTLQADDGPELTELDHLLEARGLHVTHMVNPYMSDFCEQAASYQAVFINFAFCASWGIGSPRSIGAHNRLFMRGFASDHPCAVFTSFGSPYHLRDFPFIETYVNVHSPSAASQRAAVAAWFGEIPMSAVSPVDRLTRSM